MTISFLLQDESTSLTSRCTPVIIKSEKTSYISAILMETRFCRHKLSAKRVSPRKTPLSSHSNHSIFSPFFNPNTINGLVMSPNQGKLMNMSLTPSPFLDTQKGIRSGSEFSFGYPQLDNYSNSPILFSEPYKRPKFTGSMISDF